MDEIKIEVGEKPKVRISKYGHQYDFDKLDSWERWQVIEKLDEAKEELIRIHRSSW